MNWLNLLGFSSNCYLCGCRQHSNGEKADPKATASAFISTPLLCQYCHQRLPISKHGCFTCGLPMFARAGVDNTLLESEQLSCGECLMNSPPYDRVVSAFHYEAPVSDFITQLKYSSQFQLLPLLSSYLAKKIRESYAKNDLPKLMIAMPLHPVKLTTRGFNQSRLIADKLSQALEIPVLSNGVERVKNTQAQSGLDSVERKKNMKNAFKVQTRLPSHVAIIDDVVTTSMTVTELTNGLLKNGAQRVDVWSIARAYDL